jgi:hypothetical protein
MSDCDRKLALRNDSSAAGRTVKLSIVFKPGDSVRCSCFGEALNPCRVVDVDIDQDDYAPFDAIVLASNGQEYLARYSEMEPAK